MVRKSQHLNISFLISNFYTLNAIKQQSPSFEIIQIQFQNVLDFFILILFVV